MEFPSLAGLPVGSAAISKCGKYCQMLQPHHGTDRMSMEYYRVSLDDCQVCTEKDAIFLSLMNYDNSISIEAPSRSGFMEFHDILLIARKRILRFNLQVILRAIFTTDTSKSLSEKHRKVAQKIDGQLCEFGDVDDNDLRIVLKKLPRRIKKLSTEAFNGKVESLLTIAKTENLSYTYCFIAQIYELLEKCKQE